MAITSTRLNTPDAPSEAFRHPLIKAIAVGSDAIGIIRWISLGCVRHSVRVLMAQTTTKLCLAFSAEETIPTYVLTFPVECAHFAVDS